MITRSNEVAEGGRGEGGGDFHSFIVLAEGVRPTGRREARSRASAGVYSRN